jgi:hypothetical protein
MTANAVQCKIHSSPFADNKSNPTVPTDLKSIFLMDKAKISWKMGGN